MGFFRNIIIAYDTLNIMQSGCYRYAGQMIKLPDVNYRSAIACNGEEMELVCIGSNVGEIPYAGRIEVRDSDSLEAAQGMTKPLVLNFANAHFPGGGFWFGASSQEETLCRRSSLYLSLQSFEAKKMYRLNNRHPRLLESDFFVLSPDVVVFRGKDGNVLREPYMISVLSAPAPNLRGLAFFSSRGRIREAIQRKIRIMLSIAERYQYHQLVLGAWGCGAFGNDPKVVSECFRSELVDRGRIKHFDKVVFAIKDKRGSNYSIFEKTLIRNSLSSHSGNSEFYVED